MHRRKVIAQFLYWVGEGVSG